MSLDRDITVRLHVKTTLHSSTSFRRHWSLIPGSVGGGGGYKMGKNAGPKLFAHPPPLKWLKLFLPPPPPPLFVGVNLHLGPISVPCIPSFRNNQDACPIAYRRHTGIFRYTTLKIDTIYTLFGLCETDMRHENFNDLHM